MGQQPSRSGNLKHGYLEASSNREIVTFSPEGAPVMICNICCEESNKYRMTEVETD